MFMTEDDYVFFSQCQNTHL